MNSFTILKKELEEISVRPKSSKTYIPQILRRQIRAAAGDCCEYCLVPEAVAFASFHIDHIISEKQGD